MVACVAVFSVSFQASGSRARARGQNCLFALAPCFRATSLWLSLSPANKRKRKRLLRRLITWPLGDTDLLKGSLERTSERYFHRSKTKFVSPRGHLISSTCIITKCMSNSSGTLFSEAFRRVVKVSSMKYIGRQDIRDES